MNMAEIRRENLNIHPSQG